MWIRGGGVVVVVFCSPMNQTFCVIRLIGVVDRLYSVSVLPLDFLYRSFVRPIDFVGSS